MKTEGRKGAKKTLNDKMLISVGERKRKALEFSK